MMARTHRSTRLEDDLIKQVQDKADSQHRSFSNMLEVILAEYFKNKKAANPS